MTGSGPMPHCLPAFWRKETFWWYFPLLGRWHCVGVGIGVLCHEFWLSHLEPRNPPHLLQRGVPAPHPGCPQPCSLHTLPGSSCTDSWIGGTDPSGCLGSHHQTSATRLSCSENRTPPWAYPGPSTRQLLLQRCVLLSSPLPSQPWARFLPLSVTHMWLT